MNSWILVLICAAFSCVKVSGQNVGPQPPPCPVTIWNGSTWSNGVPNSGKAATFAGNYTSTGDLTACSVRVNAGAIVIFKNVSPTDGHTLYVVNRVTVIPGGRLKFEDNAGLVQVSNVTNSGDITYQRNTTPGSNFDYTYWSSPVKNQLLHDVSPNTLSDKYWEHNGTVWVNIPNGNTIMLPGKGYIARGDQAFQGYNDVSTANFVGEPHNGDFIVPTTPLTLIGNPYPSAISADRLLAQNAGGEIYFWTHHIPIDFTPTTPDVNGGPVTIYNYNAWDYAVYNRFGSVSTSYQSYLGGVGYTPSPGQVGFDAQGNAPTGFIAAGQGFFHAKNGVSFFITFKNNMRVGSNSGQNGNFYRGTDSIQTMPTIERHRIWLQIRSMDTAPQQLKQCLFGYSPDATTSDALDDGMDSKVLSFPNSPSPTIGLYSLATPTSTDHLVVQARNLASAFDINDVIPLGFTCPAGNMEIHLSKSDGLFARECGNQPFYLRELVNGNYNYYDISKTPYTSFEANAVVDNTERLQIVFSVPNSTKLIAAHCGSTRTVNQSINANVIAGATSYGWYITRQSDLATATLTTSSDALALNNGDFAAGFIHAGEDYCVQVRALVAGVWAPYGNPCNITVPCDNILDLYIKDKANDVGLEPNTITQYMWESDDIWVRNNNDNGLTHQNPEFTGNGNSSPNFIKVRVINRSCVASTGNEHLTVNWAKAATNQNSNSRWSGSVPYPPTGAAMGGLVGTLNIPQLQPGQETIITFPWQVPSPINYGSNGVQWQFSLKAKIVSPLDPMTFPETNNINTDARNNNNIAWKNITVVDVLPNNTADPGGVISVGNATEIDRPFYLELAVSDLESGKPIYDEAEVSLKMDETLYGAWERGGKQAQLLDLTLEENRKIANGNHVLLKNVLCEGNEIGTMRLSFNFLTQELTEKTNYVYRVMQKDSETGEIIGGETFVINKNPRASFEADAGGDKEVDLNEAITISATDINEPAIYNWYDSAGNLIYTGKDLEIANAVAAKYKLEVISAVDGFKDYKEVEVKLKPNRLEAISPNPAIENATVNYKLNDANSAYLMVVDYYMSEGISNNYVIDVNSSETTINLSNYPNGFYKVILVVNGAVVDAKILSKL